MYGSMMDTIIRSDMEEVFNRCCDWNQFNGKTVLITGAYGMLASYLTYFFIYLREENGIEVNLILLVRSEYKLRKCIGDKHREYIEVYYGGLENPISIDSDVDYIIHAASLASPQYYATCPVDVLIPNTIGTYHLLKLAAEKEIEGFLLFSTGDIYGQVTVTNIIDEKTYGIMDPLEIHNCYSESKRMAETMCYSYMVQYGIPVKIARIWHTYSPTMDIENDPRVFASFVKNVINGENIIMKSDGLGKRSFCYITDALYGFMKILLEGKSGEAYNICNESQFLSIFQLAELIARLRPEKELKVIRRERDVNEHYVENIHLAGQETCPTSDKLKALGWQPLIDAEIGFDRVLRFKGI